MADNQEYGSGEGGKRQAEDQRHNQNKRPRGDYNQITFRLMIRSINAGGVIGKGGENIKRLRSDYDAKVSIPDCNGPERVIKIVTKTLDNALDCIKDVIPNIGEKKHSQDQNNSYIRVMVHQSHAGAIIGRSGFKIKELREKTGAQFKVYTETCPKSTERVVQLTGTPDVIVKAAREVYEICDETPIKGPVQDYDPFCHELNFYNRYGGYLFDPAEEGHGDDRGGYGGERGGGGGHGGGGQWRGPPMGRGGSRGGYDRGAGGGNDSYGYGRSPYGGGGGGGGGPQMGGGGGYGMRGGRGGRGRGGRGGMGGSRGGFQRSQHSGDQGYDFGGDSGRGQSNFGGGGSGGGGGFEGGADAGGEAVQTQQVTIPNDLAGSIIGKGGQRIKRIRIQSQAQIKIDDPLQGAKDRIITITGTQQGIAHAKFLLQSSVREYQSGGGGGNQ